MIRHLLIWKGAMKMRIVFDGLELICWIVFIVVVGVLVWGSRK